MTTICKHFRPLQSVLQKMHAMYVCLCVFIEDARLPVKVSDFAGHLKKMHKNTDHLFSEEYEVKCVWGAWLVVELEGVVRGKRWDADGEEIQ